MRIGKRLLLDFDGVCLKHAKAEKVVIKRIEQFANIFLKVKPNTISSLNQELYKTTGHTVKGLVKLGFPVFMNDFNAYVYETIDYDKIFKDLRNTNKDDIAALVDLKHFCDDNNIPVSVFSNAPSSWCENILQLMSDELTGIHNINEYIDTQCHHYLKPSKNIFEIIEKKHMNDTLYFVDDKFGNFINIYRNPRWVKLFFSKNDHDHRINDTTYIISHLSKIKQYLL